MDLVINKKLGFDYEIVEKFESGIELLGNEVKSIRAHQGSLLGSYVMIRAREAFLIGFDLPGYQGGNGVENYDKLREKKLILKRKEIEYLSKLENGKSLTIVPIRVYNKGRRLKVEIAIVKAKKKHDKRQVTMKREGDRTIDRVMKGKR